MCDEWKGGDVFVSLGPGKKWEAVGWWNVRSYDV